MKKRVYFVRHGESEANVKRIHGGPHHPLTEQGRKQAEFVAERCSKLPVQAVFASTMMRAQQTGEIIAKKLNLPLGTVEGFEELRGPAEFMERSIDEEVVAAAFERINKTAAPGYRIADEENFDDLVRRASKALDFLSEQKEEHIALVTHGLFLRHMVALAVFGKDITPHELYRVTQSFKSENTGITVLEYNPDKPETPWVVRVWNDHAHLG